MSIEFSSIEEDINLKNQERIKKIENRESKRKYYCALKADYKVGDIITGISTNSSIDKPSVFLTTSEKPHFTLKEREDLKKYTIYRVVPIGKVKTGYNWAELAVGSVRVVEVLGSAKSFVEKDQYSHVKFFNKDPLVERRVEEFYHNKNIEKPNENGKKLLEKINKKYDLK